MQKIIRFFLYDRKRRCLVAGIVLWWLRKIRDVEKDEMSRNSEMLERFGSMPNRNSYYYDIEEEYLSCEYAFETLDSAIDELEIVY